MDDNFEVPKTFKYSISYCVENWALKRPENGSGTELRNFELGNWNFRAGKQSFMKIVFGKVLTKQCSIVDWVGFRGSTKLSSL